MIQEDYCSKEVSGLLKEKGFSEYTQRYFYNEEPFICCNYDTNWNSKGDKWISQPTLQMAMKWLRKVHKLFVEIYCIPSYTEGLVVWRYMIRNCETCDEVDYPNGYPAQEYLIFEEAVDAALLYVLENLI